MDLGLLDMVRATQRYNKYTFFGARGASGLGGDTWGYPGTNKMFYNTIYRLESRWKKGDGYLKRVELEDLKITWNSFLSAPQLQGFKVLIG